MKLLSRLLTASLTVGLALYALISFPLVLLTNVAAGTLLLAVAALLLRRRLTKSPTSSIGATESFLLMFGVVVTTQTLIACDFYGTQRPLDSTLGYAVVVCLVHCATMFGLVFSGKTQLAGIGLAVVYTSFLYLPSFATPEVVPSFGFLALLGLVLSLTPIDSQRRVASGSRWPVPILLFVFVALVASSVSLAPHESLSWLFRLLVLVGFTWTIPRVIQRTDEWRNLALLVAVMGVALPAVLGGAKLLQLSGSLGLWPAVQYRLGLNELGRANLVARTLMVGAPLVFAFARASARRRERFLWWALALLMVFTFVASRSWGAWVGVAITLFVGIALLAEQRWAYWGRRPKASRHLALSLLAVASVVAVVGLVRLAPQANVGSFNGRLFQFRSTLLSLFDRPALGFGPGHYHWKSQYASDVGWLVDTQGSLDNPLQSVRWLRGSTPLHTHNLFLEIAAGTGFLGMCAFAWFVAGIIAAGLDLRRRSDGENRVLIAGSLLGIVASVGWGLLDVMEISPPFFSFPTWALVGLLLAAPQALGLPKRLGRSSRLATKLGPPSALASVLRSVVTVSAVGGALVVVVALLAGNFHYRLAYTAYQERRWLTAAEEFDQAARWEPLNAKYHQMRGEALINLGRYSEAIPAYEQAVRLKREFAPYHAQLGWLYWLQGDLEEATRHLQKAVEMDPREAWREGLHADLGLAYVAQGRLEEALPLFQETIELEPQMALAPYWIPVQGKDGGLEIVLDPVYMAGSKENLGHGEIGGPLQARILAHLGRADYTPRLFGYDTTVESALSFTQVLGAIDADYRAALALGSREALPLLATVAEATQLVGLHDDAERAFLEFQTVFPESAYGFRGLGELYREQGRWEEAQSMLERAVQISPRDTASWVGLAELYLDRALWQEAEQALDTVYRLAPLDSRLYELRSLLFHEQGDLVQAADSLRRSLLIEESTANRLALADLNRQMGQPQEATEQCVAATEALIRARPRPLDPHLWEIGTCLAQSPGEEPEKEMSGIARQEPLAGNVLVGHYHRVRGELDRALVAYQAAADARPDEGAPHYFLGETYQALGQPQAAETEYRLAAQLDPLESLPLVALGRMQWAQGQSEAALASFRAAVEATPGWGPAQVALGNVLLALGDREGAGERYRLAQLADRDYREGLVYDLAAQLTDAAVEAPDTGYVKNDYFTISGEERRVLFMHPDSQARYAVDVDGNEVLSFALATAPESWEQPGDGVTFVVRVETKEGTRQVFSAHIDPKQNQADRRWHPFRVDLSDYGGQSVVLILETGSGPAGDNRFDWAGWGTPRLLVLPSMGAG